ncbi:MAG: flagellar export chaperone FliS [Clostridiales bacterium]|jgi:flagellar protein FliS|nr:flagellar export chaperone FliS [Clostridiales bacterium]
MAMKNPYGRYSNNSIFTASKEELTLKLYEGALKFCNQAISAVEEKDYEKANVLIIKVQNIIREFQLTLDRKYEVSNYFATMYEYMYRRLIEANFQKDAEILGEVRDLIRSFRDMWKEAMVLAKK